MSIFGKFAATLIAAVALLATGLAAFPSVSNAQDEVTITILHNNDGESNLIEDPDNGDPGIARFVAELKELQANAPGDGVITLTSGDNFLASPSFSAALENGTPYYDSIALSGLYDAMALGNHDFDFGPDVTAAFVSGFEPAIPFLSANADFSNEPVLQALVDDGLIAASTVIDTDAGQVGVIGAITPRLPNISSPRNVVISSDVALAVNAQAAVLEDAGVNKIILISHLQGLTQDRELVPQLEGVDIVIAGGGDELLKNDGDSCFEDEEAAGPYPSLVDGVPVVTGPGGYRCIGLLNVTFDGDGNVTNAEGSSIGVPLDREPDADVEAQVVIPLLDAVAKLANTVIGTTEVDLDGQRTSVRTQSSNEGSLLADALLATGQTLADDFGAAMPDVAIQNGGGIRNDAVIGAGELTLADTFEIAPFGNFVVTLEVPRSRFKEVLENAVSGIPDAEGRFAQIAGFTMTVDPNNPGRDLDHEGDCSLVGDEGSRVVDVTLSDGTKLVEDGDVIPGDPVVLATANFLARGGDCYPLEDIDFTSIGVVYQAALADYIADTLGGEVTAADYPAADTRITILDETAGETGDDDEPPVEEPPAEEPPSEEPPAELPRTGATSRPLAIAGLSLLAAGALFCADARISRRRSSR